MNLFVEVQGYLHCTLKVFGKEAAIPDIAQNLPLRLKDGPFVLREADPSTIARHERI